MSARLTTAVAVSALIRRVNAEGGIATVVNKGDPTAGAVMLMLSERGQKSRLFERVLGSAGKYIWRQIGAGFDENPQKMAEFLEKRRNLDPDLWVVELDIVQGERFIDEFLT